VWCRLPVGISSAAVVAGAAQYGLVLAEGRAFGTGHAFDDHLRLPFTRSPAELRRAVEVLAQVQGQLPAGVRSSTPARRLTVV
jgi:DNA-binding transcriptional MocR family regulator